MKHRFLTFLVFVSVLLFNMTGSPAFSMSMADSQNPAASTVKSQKLTHFSDVPAGYMHEEAIKWCYDNGIAMGGSNGKFGPDDNLAEAHFVIMLARYGQLPLDDSITGTHYADKYYSALEGLKLPFDGYMDASMKDKPISRGKIAQAVAAVYGLNYSIDDAIMFMYKNDFSKGTSTKERTVATYGMNLTLTRGAAAAFLQRMSSVSQVIDLQGNIIYVSPRQIIGLQPEETDDHKILKIGDRSPRVKNAKTALLNWLGEAKINYSVNDRWRNNIDESFDADFHTLMAMFQFDNELKPTGELDADTEELLSHPEQWRKTRRSAVFNDPKMDRAIRKQYGFSDAQQITCVELADMPGISVRGNEESLSLQGIENLFNLSLLSITNYQIKDAFLLKELKKLSGAFLVNCGLHDIEFVRGMESLTSLDVSKNNIRTLEPLTENMQLERLLADENQLKDINALSNKSMLTAVSISRNQISDLRPLSSSMKLDYLDAGFNRITSLSGLEGKPLQVLYLNFNDIESIHELNSISTIEYLFLNNNRRLTDVSIVSKMDRLKGFFFSNNLDLKLLSSLRNLEHIRLDDYTYYYIYNYQEELLNIIKNNPQIIIYTDLYYQDNVKRFDITNGEALKKANRVKEILNSIIQNDLTEKEKVKAIHDYLVLHITYDWDYYLYGVHKYDNASPTGPLFEGYAICEGYSQSAKMLLTMAGIDCKIVHGTVIADNKGREEHSWNLVTIDGVPYHMDITWDDPDDLVPGLIQYDHFLVTEEEIIKLGNREIRSYY